MPNYKLIYLNLPGRAEVSRYLFAMAGVEFQDIRLERKEISAQREKFPFGRVPVLEVDGKVMCQSKAIERYLALEFGFDGTTAWDRARATMIAGCCDDFTFGRFSKLVSEPNQELKKKNQEIYKNEQFPNHLKNFDKLLHENHDGKDNFFVGNKLTYADVAFYFHTSAPVLSLLGVAVNWEAWPGLHNVRENVGKHPGVQRWEAKNHKLL